MEATLEQPADLSTREALASLHPDAFAWAMALSDRDRNLAEDVLQTAYVKVLAGEARFDGRSSLKTWLFGVIRRTAASERRRGWMSAKGLARFTRLRVEPVDDGPETLAHASETAVRLSAALPRLSRRQREVLHLVFQQDLTIEAAAGVLGIGVGSARVHYARGKARLRGLLAREGQR